MANRLQLKRGSGAPGGIFYEGEPVYDKTGKVLYVGNDGAGGSGAGSSIASADAYSSVLEILNKASSTASGNIRLYEDTDNGTNYVAIAASALIASNYTLTLPNGTGSAGQVLKTDGSGNLDWVDQTSGFSSFDITDGTTTETILDGNTITFTSGEGIDAVVSATDTVTISGEAASPTNAGIASYQSAQFYFVDTYKVGVVTATTSVKGIASFDSTDFTVTSGDVTLNTERIEDIVGAAITSGTLQLIEVTYDDANAQYDFIVDDDLANYDNTSSAFITASSTDTLTNKTFDANGTGNSLSNVEVADFAATAITLESEGIGSNDSDTQIPTSAAVKDYVDTQITAQDLDITNGTTTSAVDLDSQTMTIQGTTNEVEVGLSGQTFTVGLPDDVTIGGNLTVTQNLNVLGTAVTFSVETTKVEDRVIELGLVNGAAPSATTSWDLGVAFNYHDGSAKKSALVWLNNQFVGIASDITETAGSGNADPQITIDGFGSLAAKDLYLGGTASANQIINNTGAAVNLVFDGGSY